MANNKATEDLLNALHGTLATAMAADLKRCMDNQEPVPPQLLSNIIKFLKDNGIEAKIGEDSALGQFVPALPFPMDIDLTSH